MNFTTINISNDNKIKVNGDNNSKNTNLKEKINENEEKLKIGKNSKVKKHLNFSL